MQEKKLFIHHLECCKCHHRFSIESPESNNAKLNLPKKFCPECGKKEIQLDSSWLGAAKKEKELVNIRKENEELSMMAMRQAAEYSKVNPPEPMKEVYYPSTDGHRPSNVPGQVPVKTIESIKNKLDSFSDGF